jgi:hypothetical protein
MYLIGLLLIVLIFYIFARPENPKHYRIVVGAIFGIAYFSGWRFIQYYAQIFEWSESAVGISFAVLGIVAALICSLPFILRINYLGAPILLAAFLLSVLLSYSFEYEIKSYIADRAGYFDNENPVPRQNMDNSNSRRFVFKQGGYSIRIPNTWTQHQYKSSDFPYFLLQNNKAKIAEFRPRCLHQSRLTLPEIVLNSTAQSDTEFQVMHNKRCFQWQDSYSACLIKIKHEEKTPATARWRWIAVNPKIQHGIELDFVIYNDSERVSKQIEKTISSLRVEALPEPRPQCLTPAEWF